MVDTLPKFAAPPLTEVVLGIEFSPLERWGMPHFGLFWSRIREDYPAWSVKPPLNSQIERFGDEMKQSEPPTFALLLEPEVRCWFIHQSETRLIQVQKDRFIQNWRKTRPADEYPHYSQLRQEFEQDLGLFCDFVESEQLGKVEIKQCEVSYINHIELEEGWQSLAKMPDVFPCWRGETSGQFLPPPELVGVNVSYLMPGNKGRLRLSLQPMIRQTDAREILQLTVMARGCPASSATSDILNWLDSGHEWAVKGFTDFTSTRMHDLWQRRQ
jgi:uncharacterized protein (TIGR04255 family)